jgi:ferredoxin-type protein NapH
MIKKNYILPLSVFTLTFILLAFVQIKVARPMMILGGPIYRGQLSVMTILFLSTVILTGPAWCSQLCYFGAFDNLAPGAKIQTLQLHSACIAMARI